MKNNKLRDVLQIMSYVIALFSAMSAIGSASVAHLAVFAILLASAAVFDINKLRRPHRIVFNAVALALIAVMFIRIRYGYVFEALAEVLLCLLATTFAMEPAEKRSWRRPLTMSFAILVSCSAVAVNKSFLFCSISLFVLYSVYFTLLQFLMRGGQELGNDMLKALIKLSLMSFLVVVPLAALIFFAAPRSSAPMFGIHGRTSSASTGYTDSIQLGAAQNIDESSKLAFRVEMEKMSFIPYWRGNILDVFVGNAWMPSGVPINTQMVSDSADSKKIKQVFYLEPSYNSNAVFALDRPVSLYGTNIVYLGESTYANIGFWRGQTLKYSALSNPSAEIKAGMSQFSRQHYLQFPYGRMSRLKKLADDLTRNKKTDREKINVFMKYFSPPVFAYSLKNLPQGDNALEDFVFKTKKGNCEYYASALGAMLRMSGIPSRLIGGYVGGKYNEAGHFYSVLDSNAHVWVEAWLEDEGVWIRLDPTPPSTDEGPSMFSAFDKYLDYSDYLWSRFVFGYNWQLQTKLYENIAVKFRSLSSVRNQIKISVSGIIMPIVLSFVFVALVLLILKILLATQISREALLLKKFDATMARHGYKRKPGQGLLEFADTMKSANEKIAVSAFANLYYSICCTGNKIDDLTAIKLKNITKEIRHIK